MNKKIKLRELLLKAHDCHKKNNLEEAKQIYISALNLETTNFEAHNNLGVIYNQLGENQKAIECYKNSILYNPNFIKGHGNLALNYYNIGDLENSYKHHKKFLKLRSNDTVTSSKIDDVISNLVIKLQNQNQVPTFFDNATKLHLTQNKNSKIDYCQIFQNGQNSKINRYVSFEERINSLSNFNNNQLFNGLPFLASQGIHSLIKWKNIPLFKTTYDLSIYSMILQEVKPDIIIELGSGEGGSAIWLADQANIIGLKTHVYSFDIKVPKVEHKNVTFINSDLNNVKNIINLKLWSNLRGKKILLEDAHVNILNILNFFDGILNKEDYLIVEDSENKQKEINTFIQNKNQKYKLDQFYLDFFGTNITSCINSIFKCF
tara:strand:- start:418 stop:1545 length:1128 start_codon:yes stop_codon:yes gene_type:complete